MEGLLVLDSLTIQSHKGPYSVRFDDTLLENPDQLIDQDTHFIVDSNVARLYPKFLKKIVSNPRTILIDAKEKNKSIEQVIPLIRRLVDNKIRRNHSLMAIGGGIIQDITCFIASNLQRGLRWTLVPTTLLAQADSCIGSKSSINLGDTKNILGTFNPPKHIILCTDFLETLEDKDIHSGIGEIIKVHAIDGEASFNKLAADYDRLLSEREVLLTYVIEALRIKQKYIEIDEFDRDARNIFNYGHSFGHAIETATDFSIPHGVAVTIGMDMANHIAVQRNLISEEHYKRMQPIIYKNYAAFKEVEIEFELFFEALLKDKKNTSTQQVLIFPVGESANIERVTILPDEKFRTQCEVYFSKVKK